MKIAVVIPSRLARMHAAAPASPRFIERALASIAAQSVVAQGHALQPIVAVDPGRGDEARAALPPQVVVVEGGQASQASALNAGLAAVDADAVAILEDDDQWQPNFLEPALAAFEVADFVSSTQLAVLVHGEVLRSFDFPTPSGWVIKRATLDRVGLFNVDYRWHLDNEWLGRLAATGLTRLHLVEATAPVHPPLVRETRPVLARVMAHGGPKSGLMRHRLPWPMVVRTSHPASGMAQIVQDPEKSAQSARETAALEALYGHMPH